MQVPTATPDAAWTQSWTHVNAATAGESAGRQVDGAVDSAQPIETVEPGAVPPPVPSDSMSSARTVASMNPDGATGGTNLTEPEIPVPSVMTASDSSAQTDGNPQYVNIDDNSVHMVDQFDNSVHTCRHIVNNNRLTFSPVVIVNGDNFHFVDNSMSPPPPTVRQTPVTHVPPPLPPVLQPPMTLTPRQFIQQFGLTTVNNISRLPFPCVFLHCPNRDLALGVAHEQVLQSTWHAVKDLLHDGCGGEWFDESCLDGCYSASLRSRMKPRPFNIGLTRHRPSKGTKTPAIAALGPHLWIQGVSQALTNNAKLCGVLTKMNRFLMPELHQDEMD